MKDDQPVRYDLYPTIVRDEQNILYGEGGCGKSYLACLWGLLIQTGESRLGFKPQQGNVLYLDYESSPREINRRVSELKTGMALPQDAELLYRRCYLPLPDDIETIKDIALENDISVVIVDSIGFACGGEPETADTALRYFRALRGLGITSLNISHKTKRDETKGPFGSVYWRNATRHMWVASPGESREKSRLTLALDLEKSNITGKFDTIGVEFGFHKDAVAAKRVNVEEEPSLMDKLPVSERVKRLLKSEGMMTLSEIASELGLSRDSVKSALRRGRGRVFTQRGNKWGVLAHDKE